MFFKIFLMNVLVIFINSKLGRKKLNAIEVLLITLFNATLLNI